MKVLLKWCMNNKIPLVAGGVLFLYFFLSNYGKIRTRRRVKNTKLRKIDCMSGTEFELYLRDLFQTKGYKVWHKGQTGDMGCDLLIKKNGTKTVVQAKRYQSHVGVKAVQEVHAAKDYYQAKQAVVVTNSYFTPAAQKLASKLRVELVDRTKLIQYIKEI